jgi:hypothetical protein
MDDSVTKGVIQRLDCLERENQDLTNRLDRLSRVHRFWKRIGGLAAIAALVFLFAAPSWPDKVVAPGVETQTLILLDPHRRIPRFEMVTERERAVLRINGLNGKPQIEMVVSGEEPPSILFMDPQGNKMARLP